MSSTTIYGALPTASSGPYHYLYRITNLVKNKHYYGIRTSRNTLPQQDLGVKYFSSSRDKHFIKDQKEHPENYRYKVVITSDSRQRVADLEIKLHNKFNVGVNEKFYNKAIQTSIGFDASGKVPMRDSDGHIYHVSVNDPRIASGELYGVHKGTAPMKDKNGIVSMVSVNDSRIASGELKHISEGMVCVKDKTGNYIKVPVDDYRISTGELQYISTGMVPMKDKNGNISMFSVNDPRIATGELQSIWKGIRWIHNPETKQNCRIKPEEEIPSGWVFGNINEFGDKVIPPSCKGLKRIYNPELKQNKFIKPGDNLPPGWFYGQKRFNYEGPPSIPKGSRQIFNQELKKNSYLKPGEILTEGWEYGKINRLGEKFVSPTSIMGYRWIYNLELKQNRRIKPGEEIPSGWQHGMKRSWD